MPQFRYRAVMPTGILVVGDVRASSREEVLRRSEYLGRWPIDAQAAGRRLLDLVGRILRSAISAGESFGEALEHHPSIVEPMDVAMVRAGEASGKLEGVLRPSSKLAHARKFAPNASAPPSGIPPSWSCRQHSFWSSSCSMWCRNSNRFSANSTSG
jgi:type II secretory pathway component PulF